MSEFVLTPAERALLRALDALGVRFLLVGMGAALVEGANGTTQDLDLWFGSLDVAKLDEAARRAGGFYTSGFGMQPPAIGGDGLDRIDLVLTASGLDSFDDEYAHAGDYALDGLRVRVLPLERAREQASGEASQGHRPDPAPRSGARRPTRTLATRNLGRRGHGTRLAAT